MIARCRAGGGSLCQHVVVLVVAFAVTVESQDKQPRHKNTGAPWHPVTVSLP